MGCVSCGTGSSSFGTQSAMYGSRPVPIPAGATSQVMVASHMPLTATISPPMASGGLRSTNVHIPTYGQTSVINTPYAGTFGQQSMAGTRIGTQPYGLGSSTLKPF